ncbi:MAG: hypothetical protein L0Y45_00155, partial [Woeseiaceae bacterium]|nr:hypothetical protein [Woeseiaceae bacterium]
AAAAAITLIGAFFLLNPADRSGVPREFETATSAADGRAMDYVLSIRFSANAARSDRERVLEQIGARDVSRGNAEGSYRVIVQLSAASLEDLERYTGKLESMPEVESASVVALQLPMRSDQ